MHCLTAHNNIIYLLHLNKIYIGKKIIREELRRTWIPFGLHCTQSAARFSLRITRVGTHPVVSWFQTYLQRIWFSKLIHNKFPTLCNHGICTRMHTSSPSLSHTHIYPFHPLCVSPALSILPKSFFKSKWTIDTLKRNQLSD